MSSCVTVLVLCLLLAVACGSAQIYPGASNPFKEYAERAFSLKNLDECFCELSGPVDVCCCDVETVDSLNSEKIHPIITSLVKYTYFRFIQTNLTRPCPFWSDDGRCVLKDCQVDHCTEDELPGFLKGNGSPLNGSGSLVQHVRSCDNETEEEKQLSMVNNTISVKQAQEFQQWADHDDSEEEFCEVEEEQQFNSSYIDLVLNPERYTGYVGHSPQRIWNSIYRENCFRPDTPVSVPFEIASQQEACLEKRAFFRLISGMHSSINIHLSAKYLLSGGGEYKPPTFGPNLNEFVRRFGSERTNGQGSYRLKNLYFSYLLVLRAVTKAEGYWAQYQFYTGNRDEDEAVSNQVLKLISAAKSCHSLFDESQMFTGSNSAELKEEFRDHFRNITHIMDCVGCSKCKLWGKVQVAGIGTALKILFTQRPLEQLRLSRSEVVSLFNVLDRFSSSIQAVQNFKNLEIKSNSRNQRTDL